MPTQIEPLGCVEVERLAEWLERTAWGDAATSCPEYEQAAKALRALNVESRAFREVNSWSPIGSAPSCRLIVLGVERQGERRAFTAHRDYPSDGPPQWLITTSPSGGWKKLHPGWTAVAWRELPAYF